MQPWLAPISTTETLWYLGLLFRDPPKPQPGQVQHYVTPADLLPHLATHLPAIGPDQTTTRTTRTPAGGLAAHLGIGFASIAALVTPLHGRRLPQRLMALLPQRTRLDQGPAFLSAHSAHYLPYRPFPGRRFHTRRA